MQFLQILRPRENGANLEHLNRSASNENTAHGALSGDGANLEPSFEIRTPKCYPSSYLGTSPIARRWRRFPSLTRRPRSLRHLLRRRPTGKEKTPPWNCVCFWPDVWGRVQTVISRKTCAIGATAANFRTTPGLSTQEDANARTAKISTLAAALDVSRNFRGAQPEILRVTNSPIPPKRLRLLEYGRKQEKTTGN